MRLLRPAIVAEHLEVRLEPDGGDCAQNALLANVLYAHLRAADTRVFYSRDKNHFARLSRARRSVPAFYTYANVTRAVASLEDAGLIDHDKTVPSPFACLRSSISASPTLLSRIAGVALEFDCRPREVLILRDAHGWPLVYPDSDRTFQMRRDVLEHNELLRSLDIRVDHPRMHYEAHGFIRVDGRWLDSRRRAYHRVFNCY